MKQRLNMVAVAVAFGLWISNANAGPATAETAFPQTLELADAAAIKTLVKNDSPKLRLINVWSKSCGPCLQELPEFVTLNRMYRNGNFEVVTINACEYLWDGAIGPVREVHAWTSATRWNKNRAGGRPQPEATPPGVNWDLWLGPREPRPFSSRYTPVSWRDFWDFGTAPIGDFFCHNFDAAVWELDLREPATVEACGAEGVDDYMAPPGGIYSYQFGPRGNQPAVEFTWYDGGLRPPIPEQFDAGDVLEGEGNDIYFLGDKGMILCSGWGGSPVLLPDSLKAAYQPPAKTLPRSNGHHRDWLDACKGGAPAGSPFAYGAGLTEVGLLGVVAMRTGRKLHWDAAGMRFPNVPEAGQYLKESYRHGWEIV